jgi:hypothetical protein
MMPGPVAWLLAVIAATPAWAAKVAQLQIKEPVGVNWPGEWLERDLDAKVGQLGALQVLGPDGQSLPAQFGMADGKPRVLFQAALKANEAAVFTIDDGATTRPAWRPVAIDGAKVSNGLYAADFSQLLPLPVFDGLATTCTWPEGVAATGVKDEWLERGPARAILRRVFAFKDPQHRYEVTFDFRAQDPWIGVVDSYALGRGSSIRWDLAGLKPDRVFHPYAYNARTFQPGGDIEDSTLQPPQHPIAALGPIWRDIWFNGGPLAFIYNTQAAEGIGIATVRGSRWDSPADISLESQNLFVNGDKEAQGLVHVRIPTDGGVRHWAIVAGPIDLRRKMADFIRRRCDIPLDVVLRDWVLDWPSNAPPFKHGGYGVYFAGCFNEHQKNPTTIPRGVKKNMPTSGPVKSRDVAMLAYIFSNPDYWPGPKYRWKIGNPNFHTDMYPTPLLAGLAMPDHPHARRWLDFGIENLKGQIDQDSFPGGSWKESISYSGAFFSVAAYLHKVKEAGHLDAFRQWPRIREIAQWFACMETPVDARYGVRQKAPLGDTSQGNHVAQINKLGESYRGVDDLLAERLRRFPEKWEKALDISSREFYGFGAALRGNAYDERNESYCTIKAGPARNHYQGDELSFYFHSLSTPLAIDYACHYSPRPWHAAMHNRPDMNDLRPVAIAVARAFAKSDAADVFVADERTTEINHVPLEPHNTTRPGWEYPTTHLPANTPWTMRRYAMLVKHDPRISKLADYLVIRDEIDSPQSVWWNMHTLSRQIDAQGAAFSFPGQFDVDLTAHFLSPAVAQIQKRQWGYGGSMSDRRGKKGKDYEEACFGRIVPKDFVRGTWKDGEMGQWLRVKGEAGRSDWLVVLAANLQGQPAPKVQKLSATSARITLGDEAETIHLGSDAEHQAAIERGGKLTVLLAKGTVKPWSQLQFKPIEPTLDKGGR